MGYQDSQASKVIGVFQEREDQMAHQAPKVLLGNEDQKAMESQEPLEPQVSQGFQESKVTLGLQGWLVPQGLLVLGNQACQA